LQFICKRRKNISELDEKQLQRTVCTIRCHSKFQLSIEDNQELDLYLSGQQFLAKILVTPPEKENMMTLQRNLQIEYQRTVLFMREHER